MFNRTNQPQPYQHSWRQQATRELATRLGRRSGERGVAHRRRVPVGWVARVALGERRSRSAPLAKRETYEEAINSIDGAVNVQKIGVILKYVEYRAQVRTSVKISILA